ncbi:peptidylprolyl isomerase [Enterococcus faecium]|nr:peptidylprolyl isomerase [Enterococcus faecium]
MKKIIYGLTGALVVGFFVGILLGHHATQNVVQFNNGVLTKEELQDQLYDYVDTDKFVQFTAEKLLANKYKVSNDQVNKIFEEEKELNGTSFSNTLKEKGESESGLKDDIRYNLLLKEAIADDNKVDDQILKSYYNDVWEPRVEVQEIVVDSQEKANEVYEKAQKATDFNQLVQQYTQDDIGKENDGKAQVSIGEMNKEFDEAIKSATKKDQIVKPVKTDYGWYVLKIVSPYNKKNYEEEKAQVKSDYVTNIMTKENINQVLKKLFKEYDVSIKNNQELDKSMKLYIN